MTLRVRTSSTCWRWSRASTACSRSKPSDRDLVESLRPVSRLMRRIDSDIVRRNWQEDMHRGGGEVGGADRQDLGRARPPPGDRDHSGCPAGGSWRIETWLPRSIERSLPSTKSRPLRARGPEESRRARSFKLTSAGCGSACCCSASAAIADESTERLSRSLREIEVMSRQLVERAKPDGRVDRGGGFARGEFRDFGIRRRRSAKLRDLLPDR